MSQKLAESGKQPKMQLKLIIKSGYKLIFLVLIAFTTMTVFSYLYVSSVMKRQIDLHSNNEIMVFQGTLRSLIQANEDALLHASAFVSLSLDNNAAQAELVEILKSLHALFSRQPDIGQVFLAVYGVLDGNFIDGSGLIPGAFFNPKTAPWLRGAILTEGIYHTEPYIDPRSGRAVAALSMVVYDKKGESRGVLGIDFLLDPIAEQVGGFKVAKSGFGLLADSSQTVLAYPDKIFLGRKLADIPDLAGLSGSLGRIKSGIMIERFQTAAGEQIGFFSRLENGWLLGNIVPVSFYYREVFELFPVILTLSLVLSAVLSVVLIRLSLAKSRSDEENRSKSTFLAKMSHEIRTPMHAIIGLSDLARRDFGQPESLGYIDEIRKAGDNLLAIINDILDFSKIESGKYQLAAAPYRLKVLLTETLALAEFRAREKHLSFEVDIDESLPSGLLGDDRSVRQILLNLLSNAVKYTRSGFVRLTVRGRELTETSLELVFIVEDSGIGIKKEEIDSLFGDFVRLGGSSSQQVEGTGLGLSIVQNLCRLMNGSASAESEYGRGSKFTASAVQQVVDPEPVGRITEFTVEAKTMAEAAFEAPDLEVLAVDDIRVNLLVVKGLLAPYRMKLTLCQSGQEAVEAAKKTAFDLLFIDHMMPGLDGVETLKKIRALPESKSGCPAIALTANAIAGVREMLLDKGFDDFISKPADSSQFALILNKWVPLPVRRLAALQPGSPAAAAGPAGSTLQEYLKTAFGSHIDIDLGLSRSSGSPDRYLELLAIFTLDASEIAGHLAAASGENFSFPNLTLRSHALKSAAASIGAAAVSGEAAFFEQAGRREDAAAFKSSRFEIYRESILELVSLIRTVLAEIPGRSGMAVLQPPAGEEALFAGGRAAVPAGKVEQLVSALESFNLSESEILIEEMSSLADPGVRQVLSRMAELLLLSDFQEARNMADQLRPDSL